MPCTILVPMGRPRTKDFDLPPRMRKKGRALYHDNGKGRWTPLGSDLALAKRRWADLEYVHERRTVADLVDRHLDMLHADKSAKRLADSTLKQYRSIANVIRREWGDFPCEVLMATQVAAWRDRPGTARVIANTVISVLRRAYRRGIEWGWATVNPGAVDFNEQQERGRYLTDGEYRLIRAAAPTWLATAMDLAYVTGLRPCDIFSMRWAQVGERLIVLPQKTRRTRESVSYELTPELRAVLDAAKRRPILGLYVVATDKGRPVTVRRMQETWHELAAGLGIVDAQFRDIRGKSGTDAEAQGQDAQSLLNHSTRQMTRRYLKHGSVKQVEPLRRKV